MVGEFIGVAVRTGTYLVSSLIRMRARVSSSALQLLTLCVVCDAGELDRVEPIRLVAYVFDEPSQAAQFDKGSRNRLSGHLPALQPNRRFLWFRSM